MNLLICGVRSSGKHCLARLLAKQLGFHSVPDLSEIDATDLRPGSIVIARAVDLEEIPLNKLDVAFLLEPILATLMLRRYKDQRRCSGLDELALECAEERSAFERLKLTRHVIPTADKTPPALVSMVIEVLNKESL